MGNSCDNCYGIVFGRSENSLAKFFGVVCWEDFEGNFFRRFGRQQCPDSLKSDVWGQCGGGHFLGDEFGGIGFSTLGVAENTNLENPNLLK